MDNLQNNSGNGTGMYRYEPISKESRNIRILSVLPGSFASDIHCTLQTVSLDDHPDYDALSYTWGDPEITRPIFVDGIEVQVTTNLEAALWHIRSAESVLTMWVDALCINQADNSEKSHQVAIMGEIYQKCSQVRIWLGCLFVGPPIEHPTTAPDDGDPFALIQHFAEGKHYYELPCFSGRDGSSEVSYRQNEDFDKLLARFLLIANNSWWSRVWTVQELVLPAKGIFLFDLWQIPLEKVLQAADQGIDHQWFCCRLAFNAFPPLISDQLNFLGNVYTIKMDRDAIVAGNYYNLEDQFISYGHRKCKDPRDKVYGLLALIDPRSWGPLVPDYSADEQKVFFDTTCLMLDRGEGDLRFLLGSHYGPRQKRWASWVCDFAKPLDSWFTGREIYRLQTYKLYNASSGKRANPRLVTRAHLQLTGIYVATVGSIGEPVLASGREYAAPIYQKWLDLVVREKFRKVDAPVGRRMEGFWRTLLGATISVKSSGTVDVEWRRCTQTDWDAFAHWWSWVQGTTDEYDIHLDWSVEVATGGRAFFLTQDGCQGLCYPITQPGDQAWVLYGGRVPFILRPMQINEQVDGSPRRYELIGDCYLDGFMDGEAVGNPEYKDEDVILV